MNLLLGEVKHALDAKNRIRIPKEFKSELGDEVAFVCGPKCIKVYPADIILNKIIEMNSKHNSLKDDEVEALRTYTRRSKFLKPDDQGRILVPKFFLEEAGIDKNVISIGVVDHVEIIADDETEVMSVEESRKILAEIISR